jgi:hypothetical protein
VLHIVTMLRQKANERSWADISKPISEDARGGSNFCHLPTMVRAPLDSWEVLELGWLPLTE